MPPVSVEDTPEAGDVDPQVVQPEEGDTGRAGPPAKDEAPPAREEPRRSGRVRCEPKRLEVQWHTKDYDAPSVQLVATSLSFGLEGGGGIEDIGMTLAHRHACYGRHGPYHGWQQGAAHFGQACISRQAAHLQ